MLIFFYTNINFIVHSLMTLSPDYMIYLDWNLAPHSHSIDVPSRYRSSQNYTASLAHKVCYSALAFKVLITFFAGKSQFPAQLLLHEVLSSSVWSHMSRSQDNQTCC